ncbi:hypothetical protein A2U01_0118615, partial [Trifolium medium]|nr:hypothetical protein [Trifolium medium]
GSLAFDPEIERTARANRKAVRLAKQAARLANIELQEAETSSNHSEDEQLEMEENVQNPPPPPPPRRT